MWTTKRVLDIFKKNAVVEETGLSYQPVDNYVDNLFISLFFLHRLKMELGENEIEY